jgi:phycocyanobilin:ferredoxin oxidoreductase
MDMISRVDQFNQKLISMIATTGTPSAQDKSWPWLNLVYESPSYRRAHIDTMDYRDTHGLYMTHICIFPNLDNGAPIFGVDLIAGKKKVTGAFHDFSCSEDLEHTHPMQLEFKQNVKDLQWKRTRELPEWAQNIFSPSMIAASNINTEDEFEQFAAAVLANLEYYLEHVGAYKAVTVAEKEETRARQNWYCQNQKQNPHTPRVLMSLGISEDMTADFIDNCLFPEV